MLALLVACRRAGERALPNIGALTIVAANIDTGVLQVFTGTLRSILIALV
jgi:hypothetical protein